MNSDLKNTQMLSMIHGKMYSCTHLPKMSGFFRHVTIELRAWLRLKGMNDK
jgi:hypothetical protein